MEPLIITAALVGAELTREDTPYLPLTPEEIAEEAYRAYQAGATIVHVHARKEDGSPSQEKRIYREIIERISAKCDIIIQISTGGAVGMSAEERGEPLSLAPEMATLTTGSVNFGRDVFLNPPAMIEEFAEKMAAYGVQPEFEIFDVGMVDNALRLVRKGWIKTHLHFDFVMGVPGGIPATAKNLLHLIDLLPQGATWSVAGIGRHQLPMALLGITLGGHVRVGLEDNIYYRKGEWATSNAQLVERVARIARELGREVASPKEARRLLRLGKRESGDSSSIEIS
ncbi:3-keto-5-aminohexanoate cleavage enzyme [[Clostridium] ultunense Esp]|nr:3-keto-5-aminohexanoate cleavage enzyme [[Clostridium] ultunense Esp]